MTRGQFASIVGADEKWVENTARALSRVLAYTDEEARLLRLVRLLSLEFGMPTSRASQLATAALAHPVAARAVALTASADPSVAITVDLARFHSGYLAALSVARELGGARQAGRPQAKVAESGAAGFYAALQSAQRYGVDLSLLRAGLALTPAQRLARLSDDQAFVASFRPVIRGPRRACEDDAS